MDVGLAEVLVLEVFMWRVRVANCCVIVFVLMERAQVVEATGVLVVVMGHVMVRMGVHQLSVLMFLWFTHRRPLPLCRLRTATSTAGNTSRIDHLVIAWRRPDRSWPGPRPPRSGARRPGSRAKHDSSGGLFFSGASENGGSER